MILSSGNGRSVDVGGAGLFARAGVDVFQERKENKNEKSCIFIPVTYSWLAVDNRNSQ